MNGWFRRRDARWRCFCCRGCQTVDRVLNLSNPVTTKIVVQMRNRVGWPVNDKAYLQYQMSKNLSTFEFRCNLSDYFTRTVKFARDFRLLGDPSPQLLGPNNKAVFDVSLLLMPILLGSFDALGTPRRFQYLLYCGREGLSLPGLNFVWHEEEKCELHCETIVSQRTTLKHLAPDYSAAGRWNTPQNSL